MEGSVAGIRINITLAAQRNDRLEVSASVCVLVSVCVGVCVGGCRGEESSLSCSRNGSHGVFLRHVTSVSLSVSLTSGSLFVPSYHICLANYSITLFCSLLVCSILCYQLSNVQCAELTSL
jgi:hypothetical protein